MEIVFITSVAGNGGSAATAYHNVKLLNQSGQHAVLFAPGAYWPQRGQQEGVPVLGSLQLRRGFRPLSFLGDFFRLRGYLQSKKVEAVLVQKSPEQWLAFFVLKTIGRKIALVRLRGVVFPVRPNLFNRWIHNSMDAIYCSAGMIAEQYAQLKDFRQDHVQVLLEGVDTEFFRYATQEERVAARQKHKLYPDAFYFGTAGRPAPVKGHDVLIRAFAKALKGLENATPEIRLVVFADESRRGPGSYASLEALSFELEVADRIDLRPGYVDDMRSIYHALDTYVLPSRGSEGSSRAALEARACGLPLIASAVGVLPDLILDDVNGRLVPPDDDEALAAVMKEVLTSGTNGRNWGKRARAVSEREFTEAGYAKELIQRLEDICRGLRKSGLKRVPAPKRRK